MAEASFLTPPQLRACSLFADLSDASCERLLDRHRCSSHAAEQVFVMEQDWGESLFVLLSGIAKVRTYTADGEEVVMSLLGEGEVFGEMAALDGAPRSADVVALTPVRVAVIPPLAQRELAVLAGLARETASRTLSKLRSRGTVEEAGEGLRLADLQPLIKRGLLPPM